MPQNSEDRPLARGLGRAAGRAAQSFRENQRADDARLRAERARLTAEDEERLERRRADRERDLVARICDDLVSGALVIPIVAEFAFDDIVDAYRHLESGRAAGKVALTF
mgnify:CR=1 FL=1